MKSTGYAGSSPAGLVPPAQRMAMLDAVVAAARAVLAVYHDPTGTNPIVLDRRLDDLDEAVCALGPAPSSSAEQQTSESRVMTGSANRDKSGNLRSPSTPGGGSEEPGILGPEAQERTHRCRGSTPRGSTGRDATSAGCPTRDEGPSESKCGVTGGERPALYLGDLVRVRRVPSISEEDVGKTGEVVQLGVGQVMVQHREHGWYTNDSLDLIERAQRTSDARTEYERRPGVGLGGPPCDGCEDVAAGKISVCLVHWRPRPSEALPPICERCNDTHWMGSGLMCTGCPSPCEECRSRGPGQAGGPFCAVTPCPCACHSDSEQYRKVHRAALAQRTNEPLPEPKHREVNRLIADLEPHRLRLDDVSLKLEEAARSHASGDEVIRLVAAYAAVERVVRAKRAKVNEAWDSRVRALNCRHLRSPSGSCSVCGE